MYPAVGEAERSLAQKRFTKLLQEYRPHVIVLKQEPRERAQIHVHLNNPVMAVRDEAAFHSIPICLIEHDAVRSALPKFGCETTEDIDATLASIFPELLMSLPPKRKPWKAEHPRMSVFDAIALGVAYWHSATEHVIVDRRDGSEFRCPPSSASHVA